MEWVGGVGGGYGYGGTSTAEVCGRVVGNEGGGGGL